MEFPTGEGSYVSLEEPPYSAQLNYSRIIDMTSFAFESPKASSELNFKDLFTLPLNSGASNLESITQKERNDPYQSFPIGVLLESKGKLKYISVFYSYSYGTYGTARARDESAYFQLIMDRAKFVEHPNHFVEYIFEILAKDLEKFSESESMKKHFINPSENIDSISHLSEIDLDDWKNIVSDIRGGIYGQFPAVLGYGPLGTAYLDNYLSSASFCNKRWPSRACPTLINFAEKVCASETSVLQQIITDPKKFLVIYNNANYLLRDYMIQRFLAASALNSFLYYEQTNWCSHSKDLIEKPKVNIKNYLSKLQDLKIDFKESRFELCPRSGIELPLASGPKFYYINKNCSSKEGNKASSEVTSSEVAKPMRSQNSLELKVSTLIELTVLFGEGIQLWNDEVVEAFINQNYSEIILDRRRTLFTVKAIINNFPTDRKEPRFQRLRNFLKDY